MIALVVVLFIGVKIAFAALDLAIGQNQPDVIRQPLSTESGGDSQWMLLTKDDKNEEVTQWLEKADRGDQAYWLERQEAGEYVLFLPMQDRMLDADDITVTEEKQEDGSAALVLRIRTSEDSEDADFPGLSFLLERRERSGRIGWPGAGGTKVYCHRR